MSLLSTTIWVERLRRLSLTATLALTLAGSALAAEGPAGNDGLGSVRDAFAHRVSAVSALEVSRSALATRSESLAGEIAQLKANDDRSLLPGGRSALDERLKQHQALVSHLAQLDRQVEAAAAEALGARSALVKAIDARIAELRAGLTVADEPTRRARFEALKRLMAERSSLPLGVAASPGAAGRVVKLPAVDPSRTGPGELQDLADETRDHADHLRAQLSQLQERLGQLQSRRRLLRSSESFSRDEQLFAEDQRARRVVSSRGESADVADAQRPRNGMPVSATTGGDGAGSVKVPDDRTAGAQDVATAAEPESNEASPPPPQAGAPENGGSGDDFDSSGGADPDSDGATSGAADPPPEPPPPPPQTPIEPPPVAYPGGNFDQGSTGAVQPALVVQDLLDPGLLQADVSALGADGLAEQIRQLESRRRALEKSVKQLDQRQRVLEQEAGEGGD